MTLNSNSLLALSSPEPFDAFTIDECTEIDRLIRHTKRAKLWPALSDEQFIELQGDLNLIMEWSVLQSILKPAATNADQRDVLTRFANSTAQSLELIGVTTDGNPFDFDQWHWDNGLFAEFDGDIGEIIRAYQLAHKLALRCLARREAGSEMTAPNRQPVVILYRILDDLIGVYRKYWDRGPIRVGVYDDTGEGGSATRFLQFTLGKISGEQFDAQTIKNRVDGLRKLDPGKVLPSTFSPNREGRFLSE